MNMPFLPMLGVILLSLKLFDQIDWSWWLVLLPFYIWFVFAAVLLVITFFAALFSEMGRD